MLKAINHEAVYQLNLLYTVYWWYTVVTLSLITYTVFVTACLHFYLEIVIAKGK